MMQLGFTVSTNNLLPPSATAAGADVTGFKELSKKGWDEKGGAAQCRYLLAELNFEAIHTTWCLIWSRTWVGLT